ncbi:hypothetical protein VNI00_013170 [Paramarasmius palmivorus]|uniref:tyrosinase n=1 Tax=Paramarasmius palmivorus TaxID=297713 RepID=A0AAW0C1Q8_9AGAR
MSDNSSKSYLITGRKDCGTFDRLEIEELQKIPKQFSLFILAFLALQGRPLEGSSLGSNEVHPAAQFPEIAGIHGLPYTPWIGDPRYAKSDFDLKDAKDTHPVPSRFGGYCNHGSVVFPTWHRPYVMAIEQAIGDIATELAKGFVSTYPTGEASADEWTDAARVLRFPFWDWASEKVQTEGVPDVLKVEKLEIETPQGAKMVDNPLAYYRFPPKSIPEGFQDEVLHPDKPAVKAYFSQWERTFRHADSTPTPDKSNNAEMDQIFKDNAECIRRRVSDLFTFPDGLDPAKEWDEFSNHTTESLSKEERCNIDSLESIHDTIHVFIGGNGHMSHPDYAGFDPIFYLHHCNVDRLLALWEYVYPKYYMGDGYTHNGRTYPFTQARGTYSLVYNSQLVGTTPLAPFRGAKGEYWTSDQAHYVDGKYYSYPPVNGVDVSVSITSKQRIKAREKLQAYYGVGGYILSDRAPDVIETGRNFSDKPRRLGNVAYKVPAVDKGYEVVDDYFRMVIIVQASEFAMNGSYSIKLYYNEDAESDEEGTLIGTMAVFARPDRSPCAGCSMRRDAGSTIRSVIPVPLSIAEKIRRDTRDKIVEVFESRLRASIFNRSGVEVGRAQNLSATSSVGFLKQAIPEITLVSSAARYKIDDEQKAGPVEWFNFENHGKVFEGHTAWQTV